MTRVSLKTKFSQLVLYKSILNIANVYLFSATVLLQSCFCEGGITKNISLVSAGYLYDKYFNQSYRVLLVWR